MARDENMVCGARCEYGMNNRPPPSGPGRGPHEAAGVGHEVFHGAAVRGQVAGGLPLAAPRVLPVVDRVGAGGVVPPGQRRRGGTRGRGASGWRSGSGPFTGTQMGGPHLRQKHSPKERGITPQNGVCFFSPTKLAPKNVK